MLNRRNLLSLFFCGMQFLLFMGYFSDSVQAAVDSSNKNNRNRGKFFDIRTLKSCEINKNNKRYCISYEAISFLTRPFFIKIVIICFFYFLAFIVFQKYYNNDQDCLNLNIDEGVVKRTDEKLVSIDIENTSLLEKFNSEEKI